MTPQEVATAAVEAGLVEGRTLRQLAPLRFRKIVKKCLRGILAVGFAWGGLTALWLHYAPLRLQELWVPWVGLLCILMLWRTGYQLLYFGSYFYNINQQNLLVRKGVLAQTEITLPFSKITDVYVQQDLLDVLFGLYDVHFSTPTESSGILAHIDGVDRRGAYALRDIVLKRINLASRQQRTERTESEIVLPDAALG
jgi:membrane protein YdbS with pleckstrin-like domain